jgi:hypothetical protein
MLSKCSAVPRPTTRNASVATPARDPWTACWHVTVLTRKFTAEAAMVRSLGPRAMVLQEDQGFFKLEICEYWIAFNLLMKTECSANRVLPIDLHWFLIQKLLKEMLMIKKLVQDVRGRCFMLRKCCPRTIAFTRPAFTARSVSALWTP